MPEQDPFAQIANKPPPGSDPFAAIANKKAKTTDEPTTFAGRVQKSFDDNTKTDPKESLVETGLKRAVAVAGSPFIHPLDFLKGTAQTLAPAVTGQYTQTLPNNPIGGRVNEAVDDYQQGGLPYAATKLAVDAAGTYAGGKVMEGGVNAVRALPRVLKGGADILAKTTPAETAKFVDQTAADNAAAVEKAGVVNNKLLKDRAIELQKHFDATRTEPPTTLESGRARTPQELHSHKAALQRGVEQLDPEIQKGLQDLREQVQAQAGAKYNNVREAYGKALNNTVTPDGVLDTDAAIQKGLVVPSSDLAAAVKEAEGHIKGSSENIKIFRDILGKYPESDPETINYQGAEIPKTNPLYDVLKEQGEGGQITTATLPDLQGYYSELGSAISKGNLPADVYRALKSLHDSIGDRMQSMADAAGVGPEHADARSFYRGYMQTFRDSASPITKAISATERGKATQAFKGKDQSGIEALAQYSPELAQKVNTVRGYQAEAAAIPSKPPTVKSAPTLSPKPTPVAPDIKQLGPEDITTMKKANLAAKAERIRNTGHTLANMAMATKGIYDAIHLNATALGEDILIRGIIAGGQEGVARFLERPGVTDWLTKPTPSDLKMLEKLPPEQRTVIARNLKPLIEAAEKKGVKVGAGVMAFLGAGNAATLPAHHPLAQRQ